MDSTIDSKIEITTDITENRARNSSVGKTTSVTDNHVSIKKSAVNVKNTQIRPPCPNPLPPQTTSSGGKDVALPQSAGEVSTIKPKFGESGVTQEVPLPDPPIPGQSWWVLSCVSPNGEHVRSKNLMIKNSGSFATEEEAKRRAKQIRNLEPRITTYWVKMYGFLEVPIPEHVDQMLSKHYIDDKMDAIMRRQRKQIEHDRKVMESRIKTDKQRARARMRAATKNPQYDFPDEKPEPIKEFEQNTDDSTAPKKLKYSPEMIAASLESVLNENEGKPISEDMMKSIIINLTQMKTVKEKMKKQQKRKEMEQLVGNLSRTNAPAVSDTLAVPGQEDEKTI